MRNTTEYYALDYAYIYIYIKRLQSHVVKSCELRFFDSVVQNHRENCSSKEGAVSGKDNCQGRAEERSNHPR